MDKGIGNIRLIANYSVINKCILSIGTLLKVMYGITTIYNNNIYIRLIGINSS